MRVESNHTILKYCPLCGKNVEFIQHYINQNNKEGYYECGTTFYYSKKCTILVMFLAVV